MTDSPICRLCGSTQVSELLVEEHDRRTYHVVRCSACDLIQTAEHYAEFSPDYIGLTDSALDAERLWCQGEHKLPAFKQWLASASRFMNSPNPLLLDVGCGTGGFSKFAAAHGFIAYGFDASEAQARHARTFFPNVRKANSMPEYLDLIDLPGLEFDCITLWDVFEHIRNPVPFLRQLADAMRPGGYLFLSVPNGRALPWKMRIRRAMNKPLDLAPWEHVFYHSVRSLRKCIVAASLEPAQFGAVVCYPRPLSLFEVCRRAGFLALKVLPGFSPQIFAWARKPSA